MRPQAVVVWNCDAGDLLEFAGHTYRKVGAAPALGFWFYIPR